MHHRLAKANARVQHDSGLVHTQCLQVLRRLRQEVAHLRQHIALHGRDLHGLGFAVHVHQANAATGVRRHHLGRPESLLTLPAFMPAQGPDVVDDVDAQVQRSLHDTRLVAVQRDRHTKPDGLAQRQLRLGMLALPAQRDAQLHVVIGIPRRERHGRAEGRFRLGVEPLGR